MSNELIQKISEIPRGKTSLTEALKELELSKEAFIHAGNIQERLNMQEAWIYEIKSALDHLTPQSLFTSKLDEYSTYLDRAIKSRIEELSISVITQLNSKISLTDAENLMNKKVTWASFNLLSQQVGLMKSRMDKHIFADFEGFKAKVKLEYSNNTQVKKIPDLNNEEILQIKNRLLGIEQQIKEMFNEEELIDEDYDSQEELDNIMDDLERAVVKGKKSIDLDEEIEVNENGGPDVETGKVMENVIVKDVVQIELKPADLYKNEEISNSPRNRPSSRAGSKVLIRKNSRESSVASKGISTTALRQLTKKVTAMQKEIEDNKQEFEEYKMENQKIYEMIGRNEAKIIENNEKLKEFYEKIEVLQSGFLRAIRRSGAVKEKKPKEPKEKHILSKSYTKEFDGLSKDLEEKYKRIIRLESDSTKIQSDLMSIKLFVKEKLKEFIGSFNDCSGKINSFHKEIENIKKTNEALEKMVNQQVNVVKGNVERLNGPLTDLVSDQHREMVSLTEEVRRSQGLFRSMLEGCMSRSEIDKVAIMPLQEYLKEKNDSSRPNHSRVNSATPSISVKYRYYKANKQEEFVNPEENWLSYMPDGRPIWLPRVPKSAGRTERTERKSCTPDLKAKKPPV